MKEMLKNLNKIWLMALVFIALVIHHLATETDVFSDSLFPRVEARPYKKLHQLPDFSNISNVAQKKDAFFNTLYPIIVEENEHVLKVRKVIKTLAKVQSLDKKQSEWLQTIASYYKVDKSLTDNDFFEKLLNRVDYVPPALALTQAAIESGWGSSRFAREGNNLFGQWCISKGCGMVPSSRDAGKGHEVATFKTVNESVRKYIKNLNTNQAYAELRQKRTQMRQENEQITGVALATTLRRYSEEGQQYVQKITKFMRQNKLQRFI